MYRHLLLEYSNQLLIAIVTGIWVLQAVRDVTSSATRVLKSTIDSYSNRLVTGIWVLQAVRDVSSPATRVLKSTIDSYSNRYLGITGC